jgi:hypothetical protein
MEEENMKKSILLSVMLAFIAACTNYPATPTPKPEITIASEPTATPPPTFTPIPTDTPVPTPPPHCRQSVLEPSEVIRAIHMGGNWGTNIESDNTLPSEYFEYLVDLNVNWAGISVALHFDDSMDSTVERKYTDVVVPTFTDDFLRELIQSFHQHGICVYLTLAFEPFEAEASDRPVYRWQLGGPTPIFDDGQILPEFWPWAIDHPEHERFVAEFWESHTEQAVHFGQLAEEEGVALYSLGTETEGLFRTRPSGEWPNDFHEELRAMVAAVREVYSGPLTYDLGNWVFTEPENRGGSGSYHLWEDLELDIIGLSAYFPLADCPPLTAFPVETLEDRWDRIFQDYLIPLQNANPDRPIFFTEVGYSDSLGSVVEGSADSFTPALFNVMERYPSVVNGLFLWDLWMATDEQWTNEINPLRGISMRGRLAEDIVRQHYGAEPRSTFPTPIPPTSDTPPQVFGETCEIYDDQFSADWWDVWTWDSEVDTNSSEIASIGENAIKASLQPNGGFVLVVGPQIELSPFNWLVFYVATSETINQQIGINLSYRDEYATPPLDISTYISEGQPGIEGWRRVDIPLAELMPVGGSIDSITFVEMSGSGETTFYLDEIRFVAAGP